MELRDKDEGIFTLRLKSNNYKLYNTARSLGDYGFMLPANQIIPNGLEFLDGLIALTSEVKAQDLL